MNLNNPISPRSPMRHLLLLPKTLPYFSCLEVSSMDAPQIPTFSKGDVLFEPFFCSCLCSFHPLFLPYWTNPKRSAAAAAAARIIMNLGPASELGLARRRAAAATEATLRISQAAEWRGEASARNRATQARYCSLSLSRVLN